MDSLRHISGKTLGEMTNRKTGNKGIKTKKTLVTSLLFVIILTGCVTFSDPETSQDFNSNSVAVVSPDQTVGQTFTARHSKLNGIELWLRTDNPGKLLKIELFHNVCAMVLHGAYANEEQV